VKAVASKLTEQQKYLLNRIPQKYDLEGKEKSPEPAEVRRARTVIERWDKAEAKRECAARKRNEALLRKAREAIYFENPEKALAIIRQVEKLLKGCPS
jgi:hypothetical protein